MNIAIAVVVLMLAIGYLGFQVKPARFADYPQQSTDSRTVPLPAGLPDPVERYYRNAYGDSVPVVRSVVITGRGRIKPFGLWMPARYRFTHDAGRNYRHYIEATWFGMPLMKVDESYLDGTGAMEILGQKSSGSEVEQAMNVTMWAEISASAPSVLITDSRVRWEAVDSETAVLKVPFIGGKTDTFIVRFDPEATRMESLEAMRYKNAGDERKTLWTASGVGDKTIGHARTQAVGAATWADQGTPWAYFEAEDIRYDVDVSDYVRGKGL